LINKISLYVHIPYCTSKCSYCDFFSVTKLNELPLTIEKILSDLDRHLKELGYPSIETVFIGGGTPSLLPLNSLKDLLRGINKYALNPVEFTIESNPESITQDFLNLISKYGVNRLSIGIQSFSDSILKTLGRNCSQAKIDNALDLVKKNWNGLLNLDLITSIPGQTPEMVRDDITRAISYNPDHISFYALSLEEGTPLEEKISLGQITDLSQESHEDLWFLGREILNRNGYYPYEVSNFTKYKPCLHNTNYWELKPYLGLGPSAVSLLATSSGDLYFGTNSRDLVNWKQDREYISNNDFLKNYLLMGLRLTSGITKSRFKGIFKLEIDALIYNSVELVEKNLVFNNQTNWGLTENGISIMNTLLIDFFECIEKVEIPYINWD
jgi:oxygen-independent coproporphyrinogen III oxidase